MSMSFVAAGVKLTHMIGVRKVDAVGVKVWFQEDRAPSYELQFGGKSGPELGKFFAGDCLTRAAT